MKKRNKIIIFVIIAIMILGSYIIYSIPLDKKTIPVKFFLSNKTGFDLTTGYLNFGAITPNHSSTRDLIIENIYPIKVNVIIKSSKGISKNIIASESNFQLEPLESKTITFTVFTNGLEEFKEYEGKINIILKRT
jgi:hypothetical protein